LASPLSRRWTPAVPFFGLNREPIALTAPDDLSEEVAKLLGNWHAAEDAWEQAIRDHRPAIEIGLLREKKERLKAAYLEKLQTVVASNSR